MLILSVKASILKTKSITYLIPNHDKKEPTRKRVGSFIILTSPKVPRLKVQPCLHLHQSGRDR